MEKLTNGNRNGQANGNTNGHDNGHANGRINVKGQKASKREYPVYGTVDAPYVWRCKSLKGEYMQISDKGNS